MFLSLTQDLLCITKILDPTKQKKKLTTSMKDLFGRRQPSNKHTKNMKQKLTYGQQNIKQDLKCVVGKQLEPYELETYIYCKSRTPLPLLHGFKTVAQGKSSSC